MVTSGAREGHYLVFVRGGQVKEIHQFVEDRRAQKMREIQAKPGDPSYYGVEGLFKILEEERSQMLDAAPFGQPKGTHGPAAIHARPEARIPQDAIAATSWAAPRGWPWT